MAGPRSKKLFEDAKKHIPGGVNSPVRAFRSVGGEPIFIKRAKGSKIIDVDGKTYIDCISAFGVLNVGGSHPRVVQAAKAQIEKSTAYCELTSEARVKLAKKLTEIAPIESKSKVHFCVTGTEAVAGAVRAARYFTGKSYKGKRNGSGFTKCG